MSAVTASAPVPQRSNGYTALADGYLDAAGGAHFAQLASPMPGLSDQGSSAPAATDSHAAAAAAGVQHADAPPKLRAPGLVRPASFQASFVCCVVTICDQHRASTEMLGYQSSVMTDSIPATQDWADRSPQQPCLSLPLAAESQSESPGGPSSLASRAARQQQLPDGAQYSRHDRRDSSESVASSPGSRRMPSGWSAADATVPAGRQPPALQPSWLPDDMKKAQQQASADQQAAHLQRSEAATPYKEALHHRDASGLEGAPVLVPCKVWFFTWLCKRLVMLLTASRTTGRRFRMLSAVYRADVCLHAGATPERGSDGVQADADAALDAHVQPQPQLPPKHSASAALANGISAWLSAPSTPQAAGAGTVPDCQLLIAFHCCQLAPTVKKFVVM